MSKAMRKITYYENILEFKENTKEQLSLNEINNWHLCRTCLTETRADDVDLEKMSVMDVMEGSFLSIKEMLVHATNVKMSTTENLPTKVCKECFSKITALYYFSIQVVKADKVLTRLDNNLKGYKEETLPCEPEEVHSFNDNEMPENSILIEVEELFDLENVDGVVNTSQEPIKTCIEDIKDDSDKPPEDKEEPEYLSEEELDSDLRSNFSDDENYLEKDLLEQSESSDSNNETTLIKVTKTKKRKVSTGPPMAGYRHKQPRVTSPLLNDISCAICLNTFERQQYLVNHVRSVHPNSKAYKCRVCGNLFSHIQSLSRHMNSHKEAVVLNECEYCSKSFMRVDDLKRHLRVHTGERPYICSYCDKSFQQLTDLKIHEEKHYKTKIFECKQCDQTYVSRNGLYLHRRKHHKPTNDNEEGRYACSLCESSFQYHADLRRHEKKHFLSELIKCDECDQTYTSSNGLYLHKKKHHNHDSQTEKENDDDEFLIVKKEPKKTETPKEIENEEEVEKGE